MDGWMPDANFGVEDGLWRAMKGNWSLQEWSSSIDQGQLCLGDDDED